MKGRREEQSAEPQLELTIPEERGTSLGLGVVALLWAALLLSWCLFSARLPGGLWCMWIGGVVHLVLGAIIAHRALRGAVGHTRIVLDEERLLCERIPVPPRQRIELPLAELSSFAPVQRGEGLIIVAFLARPVERWGLEARLKDDTSVPLPVAVSTEREARQLASRLDDALLVARTPTTYRE